ncbi:41891_t:CDS:1, partial [Gigaspora margarita]
TTTSKDLTVVKASGVMRLRNNASPLNVLLVGFYSQDEYTQDPTISTLSTFSTEDVIIVTGKFRFIEELDEDEKNSLS